MKLASPYQGNTIQFPNVYQRHTPDGVVFEIKLIYNPFWDKAVWQMHQTLMVFNSAKTAMQELDAFLIKRGYYLCKTQEEFEKLQLIQ